ncbi:TonB-dependent receptor [Oceanicoccus sagamiensis]|uniref:Secretin/TonB short N-terminal domain-containing protein n=1 Tax=Oceanicoccus sagamiensis TaxID=716816 RepID=A0A1X9N9R0_9GAMM|nr:TonB-dependent receptor [Oceanicoccus sagamiensis]ARN73814.1 hypothetical protein BST96_06620 [Oceanicoccus sagamiensis]
MTYRSYQYAITTTANNNATAVTARCVKTSVIRVKHFLQQRLSLKKATPKQQKKYVVLILILLTSLATASDHGTVFNIPQQSADGALTALAAQADITVAFDYDAISKHQANALQGRYQTPRAVELLLAGTTLNYTFSSRDHLIVTEHNLIDGDRKMGINYSGSKKQLLAATVGFLMGAGGSSVLAQDMADKQEEKAWVLEEIVVTATKREQDLADVPISIVALSGETIDSRGIQTVSDLSYLIPNLSESSTGPGDTTYVLRGIGNTAGSSPLVGMYLDETPLSVARLFLDVRAHDLERVEVLRGPQGTLFGQGSVGGTIRLITKKPELNSSGGQFGFTTYDTKGGDWSEELQGVLNIPVIDDTLAFRISATYENKAGWIDQIDDDRHIIRENINSNEGSNIRIKGLWQATDNLEVLAGVVRHRINAGGPNLTQFLPSGEFESSDSVLMSSVDRNTPFGFDDEHDIYNITATYDLGYAVLIATASKVDISRLNDNSSIFLTLPSEDMIAIESHGVLAESEITSQEIRLSSTSDGALEWTLGVFHADTEASDQTAEDFFDFRAFGVDDIDVAGGNPTLPTVSSSDATAIFGDITYAFNNLWTLGFGTRVFKDDRSIFTAENGFSGEDDFEKVSSKIHLSYAASDDMNVYFSIAEGFRSGGFNPPESSGSVSYGPEELLTYELGTKAAWLDDRLTTEFAIYFSEYDDFQSDAFDPDDLTLVLLQNSGTAEIQGIEWDVRWAMNPDLTVGFNGNITDAEFTSLNSGVTDKVVGDPLNLVAEYSYSFTADYQFHWSASTSGYIRADYHTQGPSTSVFRNLGFIPEVAESEILTVLNVYVGAQVGMINIELFGNNLLDEADVTFNSEITGISTQRRRQSYGVKFVYDF